MQETSQVIQRSAADPARPATRPGRLLVFGLAAAAVTAAGASPALSRSTGLPPLVSPANTEHHVGKMVFAELVTPDLAAAKRFYGALFGWSFQDSTDGDVAYSQASVDGQAVAGIRQRPLLAGRRPGWLTLLAVADVDRADALATGAGGKVLAGPRDLAGLGREAVLADPRGGVFGVLASASGDPPDVLAAPGTWIWSSLITPEPSKDVGFYQTLFGYQTFALPGTEEAEHLILAADNYARASANPIPPTWTAGRPRWLNYVRVDDVAATAARVAVLGGTVLLAPRVDRHGGKIAVMADPAGALFGLLEWSDDSSVGDAK